MIIIIRVRVNDRKYRGFMIPGPVPVRAGPEPVRAGPEPVRAGPAKLGSVPTPIFFSTPIFFFQPFAYLFFSPG